MKLELQIMAGKGTTGAVRGQLETCTESMLFYSYLFESSYRSYCIFLSQA